MGNTGGGNLHLLRVERLRREERRDDFLLRKLGSPPVDTVNRATREVGCSQVSPAGSIHDSAAAAAAVVVVAAAKLFFGSWWLKTKKNESWVVTNLSWSWLGRFEPRQWST